MRVRASVVLLCLVLVAAVGGLPSASAAGHRDGRAHAAAPHVLAQGVVTRQDVHSQPDSEADTVVEPDVAVSPLDPDVAIAAAHDSRFPNGGAVDISVAWTADGGRHWHHQPVQGVTKATGGIWDRASDPVVAFGPDGTAYLSILAIMTSTCPGAVVVLRSTDGGRTWSRPFTAHRSNTCSYSDDKNWLVVDNSPASPYYGRVYQFWTPFRSQGDTFIDGLQVVRWSDDRGATWSRTSVISPEGDVTQNSQPMVLANGDIVDTYYDFGDINQRPDLAPGSKPDRRRLPLRAAASGPPIDATGTVYAARSTDGGATWSPQVKVVENAGGYANDVRCCLFGADIDRATQRMYVAYEGGVADTDPVSLVWSDDGVHWSSPVRVSRGDVSGVSEVNVDVVALHGDVYVSYGTRTRPHQHGGVVRQRLAISRNGGLSFGRRLAVGPVSVLRYAAQAGGYFPGDYIGAAITEGRLYLVFAVSSRPPRTSDSPYHQVIWGVTLGT